MQILVFSAIGALVILFGFYAFRPAAFSYVFTGGGARFWFSLQAKAFLLVTRTEDGPIAGSASQWRWWGGTLVAAEPVFGNTVPLVITLLLMPPPTTQTVSSPWLWAPAVPVHVCGRSVRRRARDAAEEVCSRH